MTEDEEFEALEQRLNMKEQEYEQINHPNGVTTWKTKPKVKPEALRLADYLADRNRLDITCDEAAAELRRLHVARTEYTIAAEKGSGKRLSRLQPLRGSLAAGCPAAGVPT